MAKFFKNEADLVRFIILNIQKDDPKCLLAKNVHLYPLILKESKNTLHFREKVKSRLSELYEIHPGQPDIDVLEYHPESDYLVGYEIKHITIKEKKKRIKSPDEIKQFDDLIEFTKPPEFKISHSFYAGIDEALAYLSYGVDCAWLWHAFDDVDKGTIKQYVTSMRRVAAALPVGYIAITESNVYKKVQPQTGPNGYLIKKEDRDIFYISTPKFPR
ncbi:hypothetical protein DRN98_06025, partial [Methanosarcinales archaeon]